MNFNNTQTVTSKAHPEVSFTVRVLNVIQRAKRDATVMDKRLEYTRLMAELQFLRKSLVGDLVPAPPGADETARAEHSREQGRILREKLDGLPVEDQQRLLGIEHRANVIVYEHLVPAAIRAGLVSISGNGLGQVDAEKFLESAPDDLIEEVYAACESGAGLTGEEQKN